MLSLFVPLPEFLRGFWADHDYDSSPPLSPPPPPDPPDPRALPPPHLAPHPACPPPFPSFQLHVKTKYNKIYIVTRQLLLLVLFFEKFRRLSGLPYAGFFLDGQVALLISSEPKVALLPVLPISIRLCSRPGLQFITTS